MISELKAYDVFVFGSNLEGKHGAASKTVALENVFLPKSFEKLLK